MRWTRSSLSFPLRGKCRVFEAMGVYQDRRSRSQTPQGEVPSLRGDGGVPGPAQPEPDPSGGSAESSRRWGCTKTGAAGARPLRGKCRVFEAMGVCEESLPHRPRPRPGGHFPCEGKERAPSASAKTRRPLPLRGEAKKTGRSSLRFACDARQEQHSALFPSPSGGSAESSRRWGCVKSLYPIGLGQDPEATSPARGSKKDGSVLSQVCL
ncbi:hypothetical protein BMS3Bbin01_02171 [bacterium BMS3Bbin01]|nr:hypothetical protein BMS3Bbin01_02171 [bacterium BMS3Bbin01]